MSCKGVEAQRRYNFIENLVRKGKASKVPVRTTLKEAIVKAGIRS
jgi:hypothetical protein